MFLSDELEQIFVETTKDISELQNIKNQQKITDDYLAPAVQLMIYKCYKME